MNVPAISGVIDENVNTDSMLVAQPQLASSYDNRYSVSTPTGVRSDALALDALSSRHNDYYLDGNRCQWE
jgi:hypothetical protein